MHRAPRLAALVLAVALATPALADSTLRVFATQSVKGELRDCGCKGKPLGGVAPRATMLAENTEGADATLIIDGGNWTMLDGDNSLPKSIFMFGLMETLGYDAVTVGDMDLAFGRDGLNKILAAGPSVKAVSANVTDKSGNLVLPAYTIVEKNGVKIGITGVTADASYRFNLTRGAMTVDEFAFRDARKTLDDILPKLREEADLVVVLAHISAGDGKRWASELKGVDLLLVGHDPGYAFSPDRVGETLLLRGGSQGKYLTVLDLTLDESGNAVDYNGEGKPVTKRVVSDPAIEDMITTWEKAHGEYKPEINGSSEDDPVAGGK